MIRIRFNTLVLASSIILSVAACSSAPKVPPQVLTVRNEASRLIQLGTKALREGQADASRDFYAEAYRMFTSVADEEGRIRALDGLGRVSPEGLVFWDQAERIASESGRADLTALASLLKAEADLRSGSEADWRTSQEASRESARVLSNRPADRARALRVYGSASKALGEYGEALKALEDAASIDKKNRAYIEYASDRYLAASVYSKQGDYQAAMEALRDALDYDRRAENSGGIGGDYLAMGIIAEKSGSPQEAELYYRRSMEVYDAARFKNQAAEAGKRLEALRR